MRNNLFFIILNIYRVKKKRTVRKRWTLKKNCEGFEFVVCARERETLFVMQTRYPWEWVIANAKRKKKKSIQRLEDRMQTHVLKNK